MQFLARSVVVLALVLPAARGFACVNMCHDRDESSCKETADCRWVESEALCLEKAEGKSAAAGEPNAPPAATHKAKKKAGPKK